MIDIITSAPSLVYYAILIVGIPICAFCAIRLGYSKSVAKIVYELVCEAEKQIVGTKMGQARKQQVISWLRAMLPSWSRFFITDQLIDKIIETAVIKMKSKLESAANK